MIDPLGDEQFPRRQVPADVEPHHSIHPVKHARLDQPGGAALSIVVDRFLGRLEQQSHGSAREPSCIPLRDEEAGRAHQPSGVEVVTTGVHHVGHERAVVVVEQFLDGERIHVRAQSNDGSPAVLDVGDDPGLSDPSLGAEAERFEAVGHQRGRPMLLERKLGMAMQVAPQFHQLGGQGTGALHQGAVSFVHGFPRKLLGAMNIEWRPRGREHPCPIHA